MSVTTTINGWQVKLHDDEYFSAVEAGRIPFPDFIFLFDTTGYAAEPFTRTGFVTLIVDLSNVGIYATNPRAHTVADWNILEYESRIAWLSQKARFIFGFPPCTDLAVSGSRHFESKFAANPNFQLEAMNLFRSVDRIAARYWKPYSAENPVSVASSYWRKPDAIFNPSDYGGYLPEDDIHPDYPEYIMPRDAYPKKTCLWTGNGFKLPAKKPVEVLPGYSQQFHMLGGKSEKTKRIRSASPRGFFIALSKLYLK